MKPINEKIAEAKDALKRANDKSQEKYTIADKAWKAWKLAECDWRVSEKEYSRADERLVTLRETEGEKQ